MKKEGVNLLLSVTKDTNINDSAKLKGQSIAMRIEQLQCHLKETIPEIRVRANRIFRLQRILI